jgi:hypothetical protein
MFVITAIWACFFLYAGHLSQRCQISCASALNRYAYFIVITLWLLQCVAYTTADAHHSCSLCHALLMYMVFCVFWGGKVTKAMLQARDIVLEAVKAKHEVATTQGGTFSAFAVCDVTRWHLQSRTNCFAAGLAVLWQPFAEAMLLTSCFKCVAFSAFSTIPCLTLFRRYKAELWRRTRTDNRY